MILSEILNEFHRFQQKPNKEKICTTLGKREKTIIIFIDTYVFLYTYIYFFFTTIIQYFANKTC